MSYVVYTCAMSGLEVVHVACVISRSLYIENSYADLATSLFSIRQPCICANQAPNLTRSSARRWSYPDQWVFRLLHVPKLHRILTFARIAELSIVSSCGQSPRRILDESASHCLLPWNGLTYKRLPHRMHCTPHTRAARSWDPDHSPPC